MASGPTPSPETSIPCKPRRGQGYPCTAGNVAPRKPSRQRTGAGRKWQLCAGAIPPARGARRRHGRAVRHSLGAAAGRFRADLARRLARLGRVDGDPASGWSIHAQVGRAHAAILDLKSPGRLGGQGDRPDLQARAGRAEGTAWVVSGYRCASGSPLAAGRLGSTRYTRSESAAAGQSLRSHPAARGREVDPEVPRSHGRRQSDRPVVPVWSDKAYWPCPWNAWRAELDPGDAVRALRLSVVSRQAVPPPSLKAYWLGE